MNVLRIGKVYIKDRLNVIAVGKLAIMLNIAARMSYVCSYRTCTSYLEHFSEAPIRHLRVSHEHAGEVGRVRHRGSSPFARGR